MSRGMYFAASGMIAEMYRTDTIANNLANVDTTGFKKELSIFRENNPMTIFRVDDPTKFGSDVKIDEKPAIGTMASGVSYERNFIDFTQGPLRVTNNPLDLALQGPSFFAVRTPSGIAYTRDGSFTQDQNGTLVNQNGYPVLNANDQPIVLPQEAGAVTVDQDGNLYQNNQLANQLQRVTFPQTDNIQKIGDNLYRYAGQPGPAQGTVRSGFLEGSNSNAILELVNLIQAQRAYETDSKAVTMEDNATQQAIGTVGRSSAS